MNKIRKGIKNASVRDAGIAGWCLAWRTYLMPASSFWYYSTREQAVRAAEAMGYSEAEL